MIRGSIARRYARALLELAKEAGKVEELGEQLRSFADVLTGSPQLFNALLSPAHPPNQRKAVLVKVIEKMKFDPLMRNFILLINDRRRVEHLPGIAVSYRELADDLAGRLRAVVTTATELKAGQQQVIKDTLSARMGKMVLVTHLADPGIIGGVVAQVGNLKFDYSLRSQLRKVRQGLVG